MNKPGHLPEGHDCPGKEDCPWSYPAFGDDPADWGLLTERKLTAAELREAELDL